MEISRKLADHAFGYSLKDQSDQEIHAAKRSLLDMLACAVGGYPSDASRFIRMVVEEEAGKKEATIVGSGAKVPCTNAAFVNGAMVRFLDYNDTYFRMRGKLRFGIHPNELIPATLAVGERQHAAGTEILTSILLSYDLAARFIDACSGIPLDNRGWHYSTIAGFIVPLSVGKLLKLNRDQLIHAMGIGGVHTATLRIIDATGEPYNMTKNIGLPQIAQNGIRAALLAEQGFTGPARVVEGNMGFISTIMGGEYDLELLTKPRKESAILQTDMKALSAEHTTQGALNAVLSLVKEHDLAPDQIGKVRIEATSRTAEHTGDPAKRHPEDKETADHSLYYLTAIAIIDRAVGPGQYSPEKFIRPQVRDLIDRITVEANTELDEFVYAGIAHIHTKDGRTLSCRVDYPKGNHLNPMSDEDVAEKFRSVALPLVGEGQSQRIIDMVFGLEKIDEIGRLMELLAVR
jgi:2-methylcitrate dehydratase